MSQRMVAWMLKMDLQTRLSSRTQIGKRLGRIELFMFMTFLSSFAIGCATPFFFTDNKVLLYLPGTGRRSDEIPGVLRPWERVQLIEEKGKKGAKASVEEKDVLLAQLSDEYDKTDSPNIKRSVIDAMARISKNYANPAAEIYFQKALDSEVLELNLSACNAWSAYCSEIADNHAKERGMAIEVLAFRYRSLPYSIEPGSEEENSKRKDVRIAILRALSSFKPEDSDTLLEILEFGLNGEKLDDGALMVQAAKTLHEVTGKDYGTDGEAWLNYLAYRRGDSPTEPQEKNFMSRLPQISNETGIFK